jgi:hypothetical protein
MGAVASNSYGTKDSPVKETDICSHIQNTVCEYCIKLCGERNINSTYYMILKFNVLAYAKKSMKFVIM